ncbi:hypothetical protein JRQ81_003108 [Phrynocephalus forsythii]|uniref:Thyrotropin-releasing factor n=1 Tax=Phrynocephalus forsythii TaxID=171643 RepID=A0A9Q0XJX7_9SAUR|nr:hypothetical protein JRQ81_003108 [Phrynocephalus forsythii]
MCPETAWYKKERGVKLQRRTQQPFSWMSHALQRRKGNFETQLSQQLQEQSEQKQLGGNQRQRTKHQSRRTTMAPVQWLLLVFSLAFISVSVNLGHLLPEGDEDEEKSHLDDIVQKAENILLRSVFRKVEEDEDPSKESDSSQLDWMSKRQHPGKRSMQDVQKRQHPGKREENDLDPYTEQQQQQQQRAGKRSLWDPYLDIPISQLPYLNELSKRQHPGKRYLAYSKRQHPGKRGWDEEAEEGEQTLEKRQHPGKRYLSLETPDSIVPCDPHDSLECSKGSPLLELLDNISKGRVEEKRQHPGRRALLDGEVEAEA